jgi:hypothetical protein
MHVMEFLKEAAGRRKGTHCSSDVADWCVVKGWHDPAHEWRDLTDAECEAANEVGLLSLWDYGMANIPVVGAADVVEGDVALVEVMGLQTGGIYTGSRWAIRGFDGIVYAAERHIKIIKAWRP